MKLGSIVGLVFKKQLKFFSKQCKEIIQLK